MEVFIAAINDSQAPGAVPAIVRQASLRGTVNPDDIQWGGNGGGEGSDRSPLTGGWRVIWRRTEKPAADTSAALTCAILRRQGLAAPHQTETQMLLRLETRRDASAVSWMRGGGRKLVTQFDEAILSLELFGFFRPVTGANHISPWRGQKLHIASPSLNTEERRWEPLLPPPLLLPSAFFFFLRLFKVYSISMKYNFPVLIGPPFCSLFPL